MKLDINKTYLLRPSRLSIPISPKKSPAFIVVKTRPVSDMTSSIPSAIINISLATSPARTFIIYIT